MTRFVLHAAFAASMGVLALLPPAPALASPPEGPVPTPAHDYEDPVARALAPRPGGLTAAQAGRRAAELDPTLELRRAELRRAAASVDRAMWSFIPRASAEASYARVNPITIDLAGGASLVGAANEGPLGVGACPPPAPPGTQCVLDGGGSPVGAQRAVSEIPVDNLSLTARLGVPISDYVLTLVPTRDAVRGQRRAAELRVEAERRRIVADAQLAYYDWLRTEAALAVSTQSLERSRARLADAEAAFAQGNVPKSDVMRLDALVAQGESTVVMARSTRDLAVIALAVVIGEFEEGGALVPHPIGEDVLTVGPGPLDEDPDPEALVREALDQRPELAMLDANVRATERATRAARTRFFPRLDGFAEATYARPNGRYFPPPDEFRGAWMVGLSLTWSLDQAITTRPEIREQEADAAALRAQKAAVQRAIRMEVYAAHEARLRARRAIPLNRRAIDAAQEAYRVTAASFREGAATATEVIEAEEQRAQASLLDANARIDLRVAEVRLRHATGRVL